MSPCKHFVTVDRYSFRVPSESFLATKYFFATLSRLMDMTTPGPSTSAFPTRLRQPMASGLASCKASRRSCWGCAALARLQRCVQINPTWGEECS